MKKLKLYLLSVIVSASVLISAFLFECSPEMGAFLYIIGIVACFYSMLPIILKADKHNAKGRKRRRELKMNRR